MCAPFIAKIKVVFFFECGFEIFKIKYTADVYFGFIELFKYRVFYVGQIMIGEEQVEKIADINIINLFVNIVFMVADREFGCANIQ